MLVVRRGRALYVVVVRCPPWSCVIRCGRVSSAVVVRRLPWSYVVRRGHAIVVSENEVAMPTGYHRICNAASPNSGVLDIVSDCHLVRV